MIEKVLLAALGAGVATHIFVLNRYETHKHILKIVNGFGAVTLVLNIAIKSFTGWCLIRSALVTTLIAAAYLGGAFTSTLVYRLFFNPLNRFPGPFTARLTDFWMAKKVDKNFNQFVVLDELHRRYGKIVRRGAGNLSIIDPDFVDAAYSPNSNCEKPSWYDFDDPPTLLGERDQTVHHKRRRGWTPAFSDKALREYEPRVQAFNDKFSQRIAEHRGGPIDVAKWFNLYSFDVMGSLAFGKNYGMLDSGVKHSVLGIITDGMAPMGLTLPVWFIRLAKTIPGAMKGMLNFNAFCEAELKDAVQNNFFSDPEKNDLAGTTISSWLIKQHEHESCPELNSNFVRDAKLLIVAGSDTTAVTLTWLFYELAKHADQQQKIRDELLLLGLVAGKWSDKDISKCEHLNAAIHETLRLHSPGPSGIFRMAPKEGLRVGETYLPGGTVFNIPFYTMNRGSETFSRVNEWKKLTIAVEESVYGDAGTFIPERWTTRPALVKHNKCFTPFLLGQNSCIGKNLAIQEMRLLTAQLLLQYDVAFAPGEDGTRLEHESKDHFTMSLAPLELVFTPVKV